MSHDLTAKAFKTARRINVKANSFTCTIRSVTNEDPSAASESSSIPTGSLPKRKAAVKDNISTLQSKTTCASAFLRDYQSPYEAPVVQKIRDANYCIVGKTNMDEFGMGSHSTNSSFGPVGNQFPWSQRSAGGSSGGSAIAVASGLTTFALGTDTGGSVRLPAAYAGTVGLKPSYGRVSRWGIIPYANSLDTVGMFVSTVSKQGPSPVNASTMRLFEHLLRSHDPRDPTSLTKTSRERMVRRNREFAIKAGRWNNMQFRHRRIGIPMEYNIQELHPIVKGTWIKVLETLQQNGHILVPISLPSTKHALSAYYVIAAAEAASNLAKYDGVRYGTRGEGSDRSEGVLYADARGRGFGDEVKRRILLGSYTLSSEAIDNHFIQAQKVRRMVQRDFDRVFAMPNPLREPEQFDLSELDGEIQLVDKCGPAQVDVIVCPTAPTLPPLVEDAQAQASVDTYMNDVFTVPASLAGLPAISVPVPIPVHLRQKGNVPFAGIQVIGQYWDDFHVMGFGARIEAYASNRRPAAAETETEKPKIRRIRTSGNNFPGARRVQLN